MGVLKINDDDDDDEVSLLAVMVSVRDFDYM